MIPLFPEDFVAGSATVHLQGRRFEHVRKVLRSQPGDTLSVGVIGGKLGSARLVAIHESSVTIEPLLDLDPPDPLPLTLVIALPRPKVLNRVVASMVSMGVKRIYLINSWRVEKSYWKSPKLAGENLRAQALAGLEQARDTIMPDIQFRRLFRPFVEDELGAISEGSLCLVAHPRADTQLPRDVTSHVTLAIGPEGGFIEQEVGSFQRAGFTAVSIGRRILRVETAVTALVAKLF